MRRSLLSVSLVFVVCLSVQASSQLVNGGFDLGGARGVAFEWIFDGTGSPLVADGNQAIADVPAGEVGTVYQVVPLCQPGSVYRLTGGVTALSGANAMVFIGLAPKRNPQFQEIVWAPTSEPGQVAVEVQAADTNVVAYLSVTNPLVDGEAGEPASAVFGSTQLEVVQAGTGPLPSYYDGSPQTRFAAQQKYAAGMDLLRHKEAPGAGMIFSEIVQDLPDARPEAAMALVHLQESQHAKQWLLRFRPNVDRAEFLGVPRLRAVLEQYPDQAEACALARCKMGEHYLERHALPMARYHLDRAVEEYPGTEGAVWARLALINCHIWNDEPEKARPHFEALRQAYERAEITAEQFAWAEDRFIAQQLARAGDVEAHADYLQDMWNRYRETAPDAAVNFKNARVDSLAAHNRISAYQRIEEYEELITSMPDHLHLTAGFAIMLADQYDRRPWKPEHIARAVELLTRVSTDESVSDFYRNQARDFLSRMDPNREPNDYTGNVGCNTLSEPGFEHLNQQYSAWQVFGDGPNWRKCDWFSKAQRKKHQGDRPAWNSVNCGEARRMESVLVHRRSSAVPQAIFRAAISVAAEGFLGGNLEDTVYELKVAFFDPWHRPLGEFKLENVPSSGVPKEWQRLILEGETPEDAYLAEFRLRYVADGPGHHAVAIADGSLIYEEKEGE